ncbi:hypothetical protein [Duganella violaceipulchra]|uniref:Uncharacterized protein n=2 Tax=Duganella violaceipulchra TaxID=2849652 RepID=A0AA41HEY5_9BURK|nr:hypothetical protein [Duganella violaceicalia]MBV6323284.1 hypothetical protein [Duganella violaceicalia]
MTMDSYSGPTLSVTISREGSRIHRLVDDIIQPLRANKLTIRRDPMVEALFGAASPRKVAAETPRPPKR